MTTLTARRRNTSRRTPTLLISALTLVILTTAMLLTLPQLMSGPAVTHQSVGLASATGGNEDHPVLGRTAVRAAVAATTLPNIAASREVARQRLYLQQLVVQQTRLIDRATPRDTSALKAIAARVASARRAMAKALQVQRTSQARRSH